MIYQPRERGCFPTSCPFGFLPQSSPAKPSTVGVTRCQEIGAVTKLVSRTSSTGSVANPWRFAGGYFDSSTGLYKYGTRYYNPGFGRWSQQDPERGQLNDPTSLNRYVYAGDGRHTEFCVMAKSEKALKSVQT